MKKLLHIFSLLIPLIILISCKDNVVTEEEKEKADSLSIKLNSPELKSLNAQLLINPSDPNLYVKRSKLYIQYKQFEEAIGDAKRAIRLDSTQAEYFIALADVYFAQNKTRQTKEILERSVIKFPESAEALMKLSELYFIVKQYQQAIENINKALRINENIARAYYLKGSIYRESGDTARAISSLETAIEQDNKFTDAYYDLGVIYAARKNQLAFDYYANATRSDPGYIEAYYAKAKLLQDIGKYDEAINAYTNLISRNKMYFQAYYNIGAIYLDAKRNYPKAIEYLTKTIEINNQFPPAYFARGYAFTKIGEKQKAVDDYKNCLRLDPDYSDATIGLRQLN